MKRSLFLLPKSWTRCQLQLLSINSFFTSHRFVVSEIRKEQAYAHSFLVMDISSRSMLEGFGIQELFFVPELVHVSSLCSIISSSFCKKFFLSLRACSRRVIFCGENSIPVFYLNYLVNSGGKLERYWAISVFGKHHLEVAKYEEKNKRPKRRKVRSGK